jgi:uncharacterized protein YraI
MIDRQATSGGGKLLRRLVAGTAALAALGIGVIAFSSPASASVSGRVITPAGTGLNVRSAPNTSAGVLRSVSSGSYVSFNCYVQGEAITGPYGTETLWDQLDDGGYASDAWIYTGSNSAVVPQCSSPQPPPPPGGNQYRIAWTGGLGVYPRTSTSMSASKVSPALAEGAVVTISCETTGETVTDTAGYTSSLWDQLDSGYYVANVYINTGTNDRTPGVPDCGSSTVWVEYDRNAAMHWALAHARDPQAYGAMCTWFVSNALWAGGLPKTSVWTDVGRYTSAPGTKTAWVVKSLLSYIQQNFGVEPVDITPNLRTNAVPQAQIGDIVVYDWGQGEGMSHLALVTGIASGSYPLVSEMGQYDMNPLHAALNKIIHIRSSYVSRGWTYSKVTPGWLQEKYPHMKAYLVHFNAGPLSGPF